MNLECAEENKGIHKNPTRDLRNWMNGHAKIVTGYSEKMQVFIGHIKNSLLILQSLTLEEGGGVERIKWREYMLAEEP